MSTGDGPNYVQLYLEGRIQPGHEMFDELHRMYGPTPEGKRRWQAQVEDEVTKDGLNTLNIDGLNSIISSEKIAVTDGADRNEKIRTIRKSRKERLKEELEHPDMEGHVAQKGYPLASAHMQRAKELDAERAKDEAHKLERSNRIAEMKAVRKEEYEKRKEEHRLVMTSMAQVTESRNPIAKVIEHLKKKKK